MSSLLRPHADQPLTLSNEAWECIDAINSAKASAECISFLADQMKRTQQQIKDTTPDIGEDMWFRTRYSDGLISTFSFSDSAIQQYQPLLRSSICFGVAVRVLGAYEAYVRKIVSHTEKTPTASLDGFKKKHKTKNVFKIGRGLDFFEEVLGCQMPTDACKPILNFFFEMRNVAVHNSSRADEKLCVAAQSKYIKGDSIREGDLVEWNIHRLNQLHGLMLGLIPGIDQSVSLELKLSQMTKARPWYYEDAV